MSYDNLDCVAVDNYTDQSSSPNLLQSITPCPDGYSVFLSADVRRYFCVSDLRINYQADTSLVDSSILCGSNALAYSRIFRRCYDPGQLPAMEPQSLAEAAAVCALGSSA